MEKKKILLVEDEPSIVKVVKRRLELQGYEVFTAPDGAEGLEAARRERPDLIISDIMMPKMDGYTMIKALRADPATARLPIIILTAKPKMQDLFFFEGVRDMDYIVKPFQTDEMLQKVEQLLARVHTYLESGPQTAPPPERQ